MLNAAVTMRNESNDIYGVIAFNEDVKDCTEVMAMMNEEFASTFRGLFGVGDTISITYIEDEDDEVVEYIHKALPTLDIDNLDIVVVTNINNPTLHYSI